MAGDWIKWTKGFGRKPEVVAMADILGLSRQHVATAFMEIGEWLDSEGVPDDEDDPDSDITVTLLSRSDRDKRAYLLSHIDDICRVPGMAESLEKVGWITLTRRSIIFRHAARHNSETAKVRALASRRQKKSRAKRGAENCHASTVTREEKRREEELFLIDHKSTNSQRNAHARGSIDWAEALDFCRRKFRPDRNPVFPEKLRASEGNFLLKVAGLRQCGRIAESAIDSGLEAIRHHDNDGPSGPIENQVAYFRTVLQESVPNLEALLKSLHVPQKSTEKDNAA